MKPVTCSRPVRSWSQFAAETKSPATWEQFPSHHYNAVASWGVDSKGEVTNVYA